MPVISDSESLASFCARVGNSDYITVDTEFMRERTFWPLLCLVQVAGPDEATTIDPLAPGIDLKPLLDLLYDPRLLKVFHAARQDLEIFFHMTGEVPHPLFDTQVASLPLDVTRTADALVVEAALPGIKPEDVEITVEDGTLSIHGEFREERREGEGESLVSEIRRGSVSRAISLPSGLEADKATATFEHGVLKLRIPKAESVKPRQIRISPTVEGTSTEAKPIEAPANGSKPEPVSAGREA